MRSHPCQRDFVPIVIVNSSTPSRRLPSRVSQYACSINGSVQNMLDVDPKVYIIRLTMPRRRPAPEDPKAAALRAAGALHPHPEVITDELFRQSRFFDRRDRVQVKYEMLRAHDVDGRPITQVARAFGVSRQAVYAAAAAFRAQGIPGLLPRRRGPQRAHKCTDEILDFAEQWRAGQAAGDASVVEAIHRQFSVTIHPRSLRRARARRAKKGAKKGAARS